MNFAQWCTMMRRWVKQRTITYSPVNSLGGSRFASSGSPSSNVQKQPTVDLSICYPARELAVFEDADCDICVAASVRS